MWVYSGSDPLTVQQFTVCISPVWSTQYVQYKDSKRWVLSQGYTALYAHCAAQVCLSYQRARISGTTRGAAMLFFLTIFSCLWFYSPSVYSTHQAWFRVVKWVVGDYGIVVDSFIGWSLHVSASHLLTLPAWVTSRSFYSEKRLITILTYTVKSGNFVTFFAQNIFFHKISWR